MRKLACISILAVVTMALLPTSVFADSTNYTLKMWIAPLECTRSETVDGTETTIILTPKQCDDLLHPPTDSGHHGGSGSTPNAPDTGIFHDEWTTGIAVMSLACLIAGVTLLLVRQLSQKPKK